MQLCALNDNNELIFAGQANKQQNYFCLECHKTVRLRKGVHRQPHYFHVEPNRNCRQHGKSMTHLLLQYHIKHSLPPEEVHLEYRFETIGRIADVAWLSKRLIFEIQYSPITAEEVMARNAAYASQGFQVIWILHENTFNHKRVTSAEDALASSPHYFSNMNALGEGMIYDQFSLYRGGKRIFNFPKFPIEIASPQNAQRPEQVQDLLPKILHDRLKNWPLGFNGDLIDRCIAGDISSELNEAIRESFQYQQTSRGTQLLSVALKQLLFRYLLVPYQAVMRLFLERACR